jgi:hypothetical protein
MANDPSLELRQKVVIRLRETSALLTHVPEARIFGEQPDQPPEWPFTRYGVDDVAPRRPSCWDGAEINFPIHSFSKTKFTDQIRRMNAAVATSLDGFTVDLGGGMMARIEWLRSTVIRDGADPNAWHGIANFRAIV